MRVLFGVLFAAVMLCVPTGFKLLTQGFRVAKLQLEAPYRADWECTPLQEKGMLEQPFFYLARGTQCYVFASQDGQFVLKLFRYDQPLHPFRHWIRSWKRCPKPKTSFRDKIERLFSACALADGLKEQTALLYAHLNLTEGQLPVVQLHTPLGRRIHLPLDRYRFALQKKVETAQEAFAKAYASGDWQKGKELVNALKVLLDTREQKGVRNLDLNIGRNFGFCGGKAVEIDFGNYVATRDMKDEKVQFEQQLSRFLAGIAPQWSQR